jgi:hypothetical protein
MSRQFLVLWFYRRPDRAIRKGISKGKMGSLLAGLTKTLSPLNIAILNDVRGCPKGKGTPEAEGGDRQRILIGEYF